MAQNLKMSIIIRSNKVMSQKKFIRRKQHKIDSYHMASCTNQLRAE